MKNKKNLIIIISIILVLIFVILIVMAVLKKKEQKMQDFEIANPRLTTTLDLKKETSPNEFFTVEDCINSYFYNLKDEAIQSEYELKNGFEIFLAKKMYVREISFDKEYQFFVYGKIFGDKFETQDGIYLIANLDFQNKAYKITIPENYDINEQKYDKEMDNLLSGNTGEFIFVEPSNDYGIEQNETNGFITKNLQQKDLLFYYLRNFSILAVYYPNEAYEMLNEEYKEKRFGSEEEFAKYTNKNKYVLLNSSIKEYDISDNEDDEEYIIYDTNNNFYDLKIKDIMEYEVIMDYYTIDLPQIIEKYDESSSQAKVEINIQKVISAINDKNFGYIYEKLNDNFKNNNFRTLQDFENYMEELFIGKLNYDFKNFSNEGETYIYNVNIFGTSASNPTNVDMQIIMKLKEERDFEMSFSIK